MVPAGVALFASLRFLLFFSVVAVALVLAAELPRGELPALHKPHEISSYSLLQHPAMATRVATHVLLLLVVGLVVAPYLTQTLPLCSYFSRRGLAGAGLASLLAVLPQIQRFLFVFELALAAAHLFVALAVLGEAELMEAASAGFFPPVYLWLF